jgi:hypothetical protein
MRAGRRAAMLLLSACFLPGAAIAADEGGAKLEAANACARIATEPERLRCYDLLFGERREAEPAASSAAVPAAAPVAAPALSAAAEADFGLTEVQRQAAKPAPATTAEPDEITSHVTRVIPRGMEPPVLELENSQQWRLLESTASARFRAGDPIVIRRGSLGSYLVSNPDRNGAWRVRRIL